MKKIFACDIDNTILYSYKHRQPEDICLEWLDGKPQSYTTANAWHLLAAVSGLPGFVPITTRSLSQYRRIQWPDGKAPRFVLVANGGILLRNGEMDTAWQQETQERIAGEKEEVKQLAEAISAAPDFLHSKMVDDVYLFAYQPMADEAQMAALAEKWQKKTQLAAAPSGHKLYFFPHELDKGSAMRRLMEKAGIAQSMAAGDSSIDLPMLEAADCALVPNAGLATRLANPQKRSCPEGTLFFDFVLEQARKWLR